MPWCPKCKTEYRDEFSICSDCEIELVKELEPEKEEVYENDQEVFLMSVANDIEAEIIESLLETQGIPVFKKVSGSDSYLRIYMGGVIEGVSIFVPSKMLERAKDVIQSQPEIDDESEIEEAEIEEQELEVEVDETKYEKDFQNKRRIRTWIILGIFFIPALIFAVVGLVYTLIHLISTGF